MLKHLAWMLCLFTLTVIPAQAKTFKIATVVPDGTRWMEELKQAADEIKQRTDGRVKFRFYPGGVMGNDKSVLRKIKIGQLHGGAITGGGLQNIYPDSQVYSLPLLFRSHAEVDYVRGHLDPFIIDQLYQNGYVSFGLSEGGFAYLMSEYPLDTVDKLRTLKVWSPEGDPISRAAFEAIGISPVSLPLTDVLTGLQTGLIDTVAASPIGAIALQWHTKVDYLNRTPLMYLYGTLIVDRKDFEKLSTADQRIVRAVMSAAFAKLDKINRADNEQAFQALKQQGIKFVSIGHASESEWTDAVKQATDELIRAGVVSEAITQRISEHLNDFRSRAQ
ncbi:C4-dicarboxylate ABC transporter [Candidatus Tenderia electrophaga]|jgi:TRAP-type C4-dicarboxylate transport system substrate-binding protein|uniref:C4-dicarboxylate ABC transporter n=1 Tax=Candidatus Tenderia electrophaga TaxID=1748243 RepID=A0A0S2TD32_9GAMM|nr:C4-dicarboxylate ABC transporter [Candidatus Tenderia electrophaga]